MENYQLKDYLYTINQSKHNLLRQNPEAVKGYPPFIINKCLSGFTDSILFANEMNIHNHLDKQMQYDFYLNTLRSKKRFSPWLRKDEIKDLDLVKRYYGYSNEKAKQALRILTKEQLNFIKSKFETGGRQ